jgi:hypothetical protein
MSRQDKTTEATLRMLQGAPAPSIAPASESPPMAALLRPRTPRERVDVGADTSARTMVYLPHAWKEKFREIAFFERRKENDLSLEAFRDFLLKKGHKVD